MDWKMLGLNKYESAAYVAIIKLGRGTAAKISKVGDIPYGRIYNVLDKLISQGLLRMVSGTSKTYSLGDPAIIGRLISKRENEFIVAKDELKRLKKIYETSPEEAVQVVTGQRAWYELVKELKMQPSNKFSYKIKYSSEYNPIWVKKEKEEISKKTDARMLVRYEPETIDLIKKWQRIHKNVRTYPNHGTAIWVADNFALIALIKSNTSILIKDKSFVELMKNMFLDAYKNAEEIK